MIVCWKNLIFAEMVRLEDTFVYCSLTSEELEKEFDDSYGGSEGSSFTAWGEKYVYFPIVYDGAEWVGHAPRNPCEVIMAHQGGE